MMRFTLPYPPSVNNYWKKWRNRIVISQAGVTYRELINQTLWYRVRKDGMWDGEPMFGDLAVEIVIYPPDKRKRDMDNIKKALFDALEHARLFYDDYQICCDYTIRSDEVIKDGAIDFKIYRIDKNVLFAKILTI